MAAACRIRSFDADAALDVLPMLRFSLGMAATGVLAAGAGVVSGQNYPTKPVRVVTVEPGSSANLVARAVAQELTGALGQQVVVDNRGIIAVETVARAQPDGYTLLFYSDPMWLSPFFREVSWDPVKD